LDSETLSQSREKDLLWQGDRGRETGKISEMAEKGFQGGPFMVISDLKSQISKKTSEL